MQAPSPHEQPPPSVPEGPHVEAPPIHDPWISPWPAPPPQPEVSTLALTSAIAWIPMFGPLGSIAAIVFGWAGRREIERSQGLRTGYFWATLGLALGVVFTVGWGAALSYVALRPRPAAPMVIVAAPPVPAEAPSSPAAMQPATPPQPSPGGSVPKNTVVKRHGKITVVDVGVSVTSLDRELARQRAEAASAGEAVLVMLTRDPCEPCRGFDASLASPLMQTALDKVRLVRVDIAVFSDDLEGLKMSARGIPAFYLLSVDLSPRDGIDGGEWDDDIPPNIAPVLGAFVRGKYGTRRQSWRPLPGSGVQL